MYGSDGLLTTLENVFAFDIYDVSLRDHLRSTFHKHGIPLNDDITNNSDTSKRGNQSVESMITLAEEKSLGKPVVSGNESWKHVRGMKGM